MSGLGCKVIGQLDLWCLQKNQCFIRFNISLKYYDFHLNSYRKMNYALRIKLGLAIKMVKVICANLVGSKFPMLHTKSQGYWPFGSRIEDIQSGLTLYGHGRHLGHVTINVCCKFTPLNLRSHHIKI